MGEKALKSNASEVVITVSVPADIGRDLEEIALSNGVTVESLVYSYVVEGISGDSRILKRAEFKRHADESLNKDDFRSKSAREIVNEFNLLY
ncbi:MAG: hypothetical protein LJE64_14210 [Desulfofustis sp.]|jgi:hypothetical protein|nr:hypothetical protein [Desulfofustis sp.]